ncbi:uncharacterized protein LOC143118877 isoform X2 [Alosa pseudoharengus]|uniref:uncharacterized protein LOC143118877 isoform X2 n=1 Tax=Alosa pseudoharengus TaxID=34774 RepID=UPI003F8CA3AB
MDCTSKGKDAEGKNKEVKEKEVKERSSQKRKWSSPSKREERKEEEEVKKKKEKRRKPIDRSFSINKSQPEMDCTSKGKYAEGKNKEVKEKEVKERNSSTCKREERKKKKEKRWKPIEGSPLTKKDREYIWNQPQLPVTCGDKEGVLHKDKLAKGEKCIVYQSLWYTPPEFEKLGGKERHKKWKTSIRCCKATLQNLIQENYLMAPPATAASTATDRGQDKKRLHARRSTDPAHTKKKDRGEGYQREEREEEEIEKMTEAGGAVDDFSSHDYKDVDTSMFEGVALPVQCGPITGRLQKIRFALGSKGKCIRREEGWLTPAEFVRRNPDLKDGMWKRDITCRGQCLSYLLQRKILWMHAEGCQCRMCSQEESDLEYQRNDDDCFICGEVGELLCCDGCPRSFHRDCHLPTSASPPGVKWLCTFCVHAQWMRNPIRPDHMNQREILESRISDYKLQCQYLLLFLLNADEQRIFTKDPRLTGSDYSVIPRPMWLEKVWRLLENCYHLVEEFVSDVRLIFRNYAVFNRNDDQKQLGMRLSDLFEKEFCITFNISTDKKIRSALTLSDRSQ